jgi:hypothetical protein
MPWSETAAFAVYPSSPIGGDGGVDFFGGFKIGGLMVNFPLGREAPDFTPNFSHQSVLVAHRRVFHGLGPQTPRIFLGKWHRRGSGE